MTGPHAAVTIAAGLAAALATTAIVRWAPGVMRARDQRVVWVLAAAAAVWAGAVPGAAPTGLGPADAAGRAVLAGLVVLATAKTRRWSWLVAGGMAAACAAPGYDIAALAVIGVAVAATSSRRRSPVVGAAIGGVLAQVLLHLGWPRATGVTALVGAGAIAVLATSAYHQAGRAARHQIRLAAGIAGAAVAAAGAGAAVVLIAARPSLAQGLASADAGLAAARAGNSAEAAASLADARDQFARARRDLDGAAALPARAVPVLAQHLRTLRTLVAAGQRMAAPAAEAARLAADPSLRPQDGRIDPAGVSGLEAPIASSAAALQSALTEIPRLRSPWLLPQVDRRLTRLTARLRPALDDARTAQLAAQVARTLLGADGPRRWFLAVQTPAELRASGGVIGNYGELRTEDGRLHLDRFGRINELNAPAAVATRSLAGPADYLARYARFKPATYFQNAAVSPDFPTVARVIEDLYPQSGGEPVSGVIAIDPIALADLLAATGPVPVPGWPVPLTADNAAHVLLYDQYVQLAGPTRVEILGNATRAIFDRLTHGSLPDLGALGRALAPALRGHHLLVYSDRADEERLFTAAGASGAVTGGAGDHLEVVTQDSCECKIDWFLRRAVSYDVTDDPATGRVHATLTVTLTNTAPPGGLPGYVIGGPPERPAPTGHSWLWVSVYTPLGFEDATLDGRAIGMASELELGRRVYSQFVDVGPGATVALRVRLAGTVEPGRYRLTVDRQPTIAPDQLTVSASEPSRTVRWALAQDRTKTVQF